MPSASTLNSALPTRTPSSTVRPPTSAAISAAVSVDAKRWCTLAVGSLVVAGLLSLAVVVGRLPVLSRIIDDPLFFKRCLVVHVDLALVVWFYAFLAGLLAFGARSRPGRVQTGAYALAVGRVPVGPD